MAAMKRKRPSSVLLASSSSRLPRIETPEWLTSSAGSSAIGSPPDADRIGAFAELAALYENMGRLDGGRVLSYLPRDLLLYVVSFVNDVDDLLAARLVCKAWLHGFSNLPVTLHIAKSHNPFNRYLAHLARCFPLARGFSMSHGSGFTNDSLAILSRLPGLTSLRLANCAGLTHSGLNHLSHLVQLRELELCGSTRLGGGQENLVGLTRLERLSLAWSFQAAPSYLNWETFTALRRLEAISLAGFSTDVNPMLEMLAVGPAHNLRALDLSGARTVRDESLETVGCHMLGLEELSLEGCESITDAGIAFLGYLRQLRFLNVANCPRLTPAGIAGLVAVNPNLYVNTGYPVNN